MKREKLPERTEKELAGHVVRYFQGLHWEVYQEVQLHQGSRIADLVLVQGKRVGIVECKQSFGLPVLEQAFEWRGYAHFIWVATWYTGRERGRLLHRILRDYGIGHLTLTKRYPESSFPSEDVKPQLMRRPSRVDELLEKLAPEHKSTVTAGGNKGGHWTPFRQTCHTLSQVVQEHPGLTLREALAKFKHHYASTASACSNLPEWIEKGRVPGVRLDRTDGKPRLYLIEKQPAEEREHG